MRKKIIITVLINFAMTCSFAANGSSVETQIKQYVEKNQARQISELEQMVNINSGTNNIAGIKKIGDKVKNQLTQLGFKTRWVAMPAAMHRASTLIAERNGNSGRKILLIGHFDTVFPPTKAVKKFERTKLTAKGPGVGDDKGGVIVILYALKALNAAHLLNNTSITVVLTGDEEDSGKPTTVSRKALREAAAGKEIALDFEPALTMDTATIARRGIDQWTITTSGNESHSATIFTKDVGDGAIFELARILQTMQTELQGEKYLTFNPGLILGGNRLTYDKKAGSGDVFGKENVVAKTSLARGDIRYLTTEQRQAIRAKMSNIVAKNLPGTKATIEFDDGIPAMPPSDANMKLLEQYSQVSKDLGYGSIVALDPGLRGAGDISYVDALVPAKLAGLGPLGYGMHSSIEKIELSSLPIQTERAALLIYRLTH
jgi:glutamate carboxypeptidase